MENCKALLIPLFLNMIMVPMSCAVPIADAEAHPDADPMNVYVNVHQNVGDGSGGLGSRTNMAPEEEVPEVEVPEVDVPTTEAEDLFFSLEGSSQSFKYFPGETFILFNEAKDICSSAGLQMAEPEETIVLTLQQYMQTEYGANGTWLGARLNDDATQFDWLSSSTGSDHKPILLTNPLVEFHTVDFGRCLVLLSEPSFMAYFSGKAYTNSLCEEFPEGPDGQGGTDGVLCEEIQ